MSSRGRRTSLRAALGSLRSPRRPEHAATGEPVEEHASSAGVVPGVRAARSGVVPDTLGYPHVSVELREAEMVKRILEFLTLKWLWDRRGSRRR